MSKPSYIGLLNAISVGERDAECYLQCWADTTPSEDVRGVISTVALREGEHAKAFAKRLCELGFSVRDRNDESLAGKMAIASSTELTDREKFEKLGLGREPSGDDGPDIFSRMFEDTTIDIQTGALLGRYIAEERDSGRLLRSCYRQLCEAEGEGGTGADIDLRDRVTRIEGLLEGLLTRVPG
ncbi:MAG: hypothetical protein S0880_04985 [Actinomycetota bacterium]|nr:hypothetical protein [Actinomycetota bacterium]